MSKDSYFLHSEYKDVRTMIKLSIESIYSFV